MELDKDIENELMDIVIEGSKLSGVMTMRDTLKLLIITYYITFGYEKEKWPSWLSENINVKNLEMFIKEGKFKL